MLSKVYQDHIRNSPVKGLDLSSFEDFFMENHRARYGTKTTAACLLFEGFLKGHKQRTIQYGKHDDTPFVNGFCLSFPRASSRKTIEKDVNRRHENEKKETEIETQIKREIDRDTERDR